MYTLSKDLIACWSLSYSFLYLLYLFNTILCISLLPNDRKQAEQSSKQIVILDRTDLFMFLES